MIKSNTARGILIAMNIASAIVIGGIGAIVITTSDGMFGTGITFIVIAALLATAFHNLITMTQEQRDEISGKAERTGVHWFWWVFWLFMFFPALLIVAIIHSGRKTRAEIRNLKQGA